MNLNILKNRRKHMQKNRDAEIITLGSGDVYCKEYNAAEGMPEIETVCVPENLLGRISGGAALEYTGEWYTAKDDAGIVQKTIITSEECTFKTGVITWNGKTLAILCATGRVTEKDGKRIVKLGGVGNYNGKSYVIAFHHTDKTDGDVWLMIRGANQGAISLTFAKDTETTIDAEFTCLSQDGEGTLVTYIEQMTDLETETEESGTE